MSHSHLCLRCALISPVSQVCHVCSPVLGLVTRVIGAVGRPDKRRASSPQTTRSVEDALVPLHPFPVQPVIPVRPRPELVEVLVVTACRTVQDFDGAVSAACCIAPCAQLCII